MIHRRRKTDANQAGIVNALEKLGVCVIDLSGSGKGVMDLLLAYKGNFIAVEVKNLNGRGDMLTKAQIKLHKSIGDAGCEVHICRTVDEALALIGVNHAI